MALTKIRGSILSEEIYRRENNLNDVLDKAIARNNLSVYSKADCDGKYLDKTANFSDLTNLTTARNNLDVYSRGEVNSKIDNIPPPVQAIWVGEIRRFSFAVPPPGFFSLDGSLITNGAIDYKPLIDSGCLFITIEGNNIRLFDQQHFGRGKGSSIRNIGEFENHRVGSCGLEDYFEIRKPYAYGNLDMHTFAPKMNVHPSYGGLTNSYRAEIIPTDIGETRPKSYTELVCLYHGVI